MRIDSIKAHSCYKAPNESVGRKQNTCHRYDTLHTQKNKIKEQQVVPVLQEQLQQVRQVEAVLLAEVAGALQAHTKDEREDSQ